jgi:integrase
LRLIDQPGDEPLPLKTLTVEPTDKNILGLEPNCQIKIQHPTGLYVRRQTGNSRTWVLSYRIKGSPTKRTQAIGKFPAVSLEEAAAKAALWLKWAGEGKDPKRVEWTHVDVENAINDASEITFAEYLERYLSRPTPRGQLTEATQKDYRSTLTNHAADLMNMPLRAINSADLDRVYLRCKKEPTAKKLHTILTAIFNFAVKDKASDNQTYVLQSADVLADLRTYTVKTNQRDAYLSVSEFQLGLKYLLDTAYVVNSYNFWSQVHALQLAALLGLRHSEIVSIRTEDIFQAGRIYGGDIIEDAFIRVWIKKKKSPKPYPHYIPLIPMVDSIITSQQLIRTTYQQHMKRKNRKWVVPSPWLFTAARDPDRHVNEMRLAEIYMRKGIETQRNGYQYLLDGDKKAVDDGFTIHWLRHTHTTHLSNLGYRADEIDGSVAKYINHAQSGYLHRPGHSSTLEIAAVADRLRPMVVDLSMLYTGFSAPIFQRRTQNEDAPRYEAMVERISQSNRELQIALTADRSELALADFAGTESRNPIKDTRFSNIETDMDEQVYSELVKASNFFVPPNYKWPDVDLYQDGRPIRRHYSETKCYPLHVVGGKVSYKPVPRSWGRN